MHSYPSTLQLLTTICCYVTQNPFKDHDCFCPTLYFDSGIKEA